MDSSVCQDCQFEGDTLWDAQPVKADERGRLGVMCSDLRILKMSCAAAAF